MHSLDIHNTDHFFSFHVAWVYDSTQLTVFLLICISLKWVSLQPFPPLLLLPRSVSEKVNRPLSRLRPESAVEERTCLRETTTKLTRYTVNTFFISLLEKYRGGWSGCLTVKGVWPGTSLIHWGIIPRAHDDFTYITSNAPCTLG